jgi:hypothetical protein
VSEFLRLLLGLHAQARRYDRDQALLGALGVGAFAYTHQIDSVHRMATAPSCRWLLADEVGLGKTIQAIMVMRALAAQSSSLFNVALVVPDDLVGQWEEELLARGHTIAIEAGEPGAPTGNLLMRLVRPSRIAAGGRIAAGRIDLLLVDEFTKLQVAVRTELIAAARSIPNVIAMTATPALHDTRTRRELMEMLEPEAGRIARATNRDILKVLADREIEAIDRYGEELRNTSRRRQVEDEFGLYRRLIRTRRTDYPNALPQRRYQPIRVAPTDGDVERARATRSYLEAAATADLDLRRDLLLQVAGRSPQSLRERLSTLKRTTSLQAAWHQIDKVLRDEPGDAKLDALTDHVRATLTEQPDARIVIVAEDNPTTDYLAEALGKLVDARISRKRRTKSAAEELEVQVTLLKDALEEFISGEANILVAALDAREGHNLQFANEIIFFALPWSPPDIQQWIGRIDRLGTRGIPAKRKISITPIVVDNSIESRILEVLEGTKVFEKSEVFDETEWAEISKAINAAADGIAGASWGEAAARAKSLGATIEDWLGSTRLPPSPRTTLAERLDARLRSRPYALPLTDPKNGQRTNWYQSRERAADIIIRLAREEFLDIRNGHDNSQRFKTMWYRSGPAGIELQIPEIDSTSSFYRQAFISHRASIDCPPRPQVTQNDGRKRQLHFFDHGCPLHDQLLSALIEKAPMADITTEFTIEYSDDHPILKWEGRRLLFGSSGVELGTALSTDVKAVLASLDGQASKAEHDARAIAERFLGAALDADRRWLVDLCPPEMLLVTLVEDGDQFVTCEAAAAILDPVWGDRPARQSARRRSQLTEARRDGAREIARGELRRLGSEVLSRAIVALNGAISARLFAVDAEIEQRVAAARAELAGLVANEALKSRPEPIVQAERRGAELAVQLTEACGNARRAWISSAGVAIKDAATLKTPRYFWVVPKRSSEGNP